MLKIGITGGIGSGKTAVCKVFEALDIPVLYADRVARMLMETEPELIRAISALLGPDAYLDGRLNRPFIASRVFADETLLQQLNALTHPAVIAWGRDWMSGQHAPYIVKEAAIFFETGSNVDMDIMVGVSAPLELRISRTMRRDQVSREVVLARIARQMDEEEKMRRCDFVIVNDEVQAVIPQVLALHQQWTAN
jgi:dephospho-CoA kinase